MEREESAVDQEQRHYERAHARVQAIKGFYIHASAIVVVNIALLASVVVFGSPLTLCSLPDAEQVGAPTITQDVAALEGAGLVVQDPAPADGRAGLVRATLVGVRLFEEARVRRLSALSGEMKVLPPEDLATVARAADILERLVHVPEHR